MELIDLSFGIETDMPTCGTKWHQCVEVSPMGTIETVGRNTHRIVLGSHSGTHIDAPLHFVPDGKTIEKLDIELLCGEIEVVDFRQFKAGDIILLDDVETINIAPRMLFIFGWYHYWKSEQYYREFPFFSTDAMAYLIKNGMKLIAMDTPSPDFGNAISDLKNDSPNHKMLLEKEVIVIEYLNNTDAIDLSKHYELIALPLKVVGVDGCPARVLLKEVDEDGKGMGI